SIFAYQAAARTLSYTLSLHDALPISDAERQVVGEQVLVRRVDVRVGESEPGQDRRDALVGQCRDDRQGAAAADEQRPRADPTLEGVEAELNDGRVGVDEAGRRTRERL